MVKLNSQFDWFHFYGFSPISYCSNVHLYEQNEPTGHSSKKILFLFYFLLVFFSCFSIDFVCFFWFIIIFVFRLQRRKEDRENRYTNVIRSLVWRYVSAMQRRYDDSAVTEDDINEVKADISAMRYEMLEVFDRNGMDVSFTERKEKSHLAKRMKVWERRLMKDFHVAPTMIEEGGGGGDDQVPSNEKGLARFRRVAHAVVNQTSTHKWTEAVQSVTDTQIGRCRNRESFRNQQNLARAMNEAKKLVEHSPMQSRSCTPLEYSDPTTNTLLELLKNITEEIGEFSPSRPHSRSPSRPPSKQERENSMTQLHAMLGNCSRTPSPLPSNIIHLTETMAKIEDGKQQRQSISSNLSYLSSDQAKRNSRSASIDLRLACKFPFRGK